MSEGLRRALFLAYLELTGAVAKLKAIQEAAPEELKPALGRPIVKALGALDELKELLGPDPF